jgi:hypothetical protein
VEVTRPVQVAEEKRNGARKFGDGMILWGLSPASQRLRLTFLVYGFGEPYTVIAGPHPHG